MGQIAEKMPGRRMIGNSAKQEPVPQAANSASSTGIRPARGRVAMASDIGGLLCAASAMIRRPYRISYAIEVLVVALGVACASQCNALPLADTGPAAPTLGGQAQKPLPSGVQDLVLAWQRYRPDAERVTRLRKQIEAEVSQGLDPAHAALLWHTKANAAEELQEVDLRVQFLQKALGYASQAGDSGDGRMGSLRRIRSEWASALRPARGITASLDAQLAFAAELEGSTEQNLGWLVGVYAQIGQAYLQLGQLEQARAYLNRLTLALERLRTRRGAELRMPQWQRQTESLRGDILRAEGRLLEAEMAFLSAIRSGEESARLLTDRQAQGMFAAPAQRAESTQDDDQIRLAVLYIDQGRLDESELLLRAVLQRALVRDGRNSILVGKTLSTLAKLMLNRGRSADAVALARSAQQSLQEAGLSEFSLPRAAGQTLLANALVVDGQAAEAVALMDNLRSRWMLDERLEDGLGNGSLQSVRGYLLVGRLQDALQDADRLLQRSLRHLGNQHYDTAEARAYRAMVLRRLGRREEAQREFEAAGRVLLDTGKLSAKQQTQPARAQRLRLILGEYIDLLLSDTSRRIPADLARSFTLADVARWQSVQRAMTGSALRAATGAPDLAARIKKVQDTDDEVQALYKQLIALRAAAPQLQSAQQIRRVEQTIASSQKTMDRELATIRRQFPQYDTLVNPRPADLEAVRKSLRAGEALLSVYVNPQGTYVWALAPDGTLLFHLSAQPDRWVDARVRRLRSSVDFNAATGTGEMDFDLQAGVDLYQELLAPVAAAWKTADTLIVVANGALGQIPFSMLPTLQLPAADLQAQRRWRAVPWLARQVAVAYAPSISSLVTLRNLPRSSQDRAAFTGFGDPVFGTPIGKAPTRALTRRTRSLPFAAPLAATPDRLSDEAGKSTEERMGQQWQPVLMDLPDTRDEIIAIAQALSADIQHDTYFGERANPKAVLEAELSRRRVIAFATHGLVPGDLPGLDQPALALSPGPGQPVSEGLLRLDQILRLSLDADLVVLSACNTAASDGAGSEAVSGLGRGFFHAGARSLLATHWPVETSSAREMVSSLFRHYASNPRVTRAQALRHAMLHVMDEGVEDTSDPSQPYDHPAFWAPYALYGDPGR